MAIIKAINSKSSIKNIIEYVADEKKTDEKLMSGKDCSEKPNQAIEDMKMTKELYGKTTGRQYKHFVQSFSPEENITPSKANEIGKEWAEKAFKGYEVFIVTHINKEHIHNHFIVNSVNFETGEKYRQSRGDLDKYKELSNEICKREGLLKTPTHSKDITTFNMKKYKAIENDIKGNKKSYVVQTGKCVEKYLGISVSKNDFIKNMEREGYTVKWSDTAKGITYIKDNDRVRSTNLEKTFKEEKFNKENMQKQFDKNKERVQEKLKNINIKKSDIYEDVVVNELKSNIEKEISVIKANIEKLSKQKAYLQERYQNVVNQVRIYKSKIDTNDRSIEKIKYLKQGIESETKKLESLKGIKGIFKNSEKRNCNEKIERYKKNIEELKSNIIDKKELNRLKDEYKKLVNKEENEGEELFKCKHELEINENKLIIRTNKLDELEHHVSEKDLIEEEFKKDPEALKIYREMKANGNFESKASRLKKDIDFEMER